MTNIMDDNNKYRSIIIATLVLIIVLISCFTCIQLFKVSHRRDDYNESFCGGAPSQATKFACDAEGQKTTSCFSPCRIYPTGIMPVIDSDNDLVNGIYYPMCGSPRRGRDTINECCGGGCGARMRDSYDEPMPCCGAFGVPP